MSSSHDGRRLDQFIDGTERLGVVGSPSATTQLAVDVLGAASTRKLVGELALFKFTQDSDPHYALGQITEIRLRNIWHEDATMRSLIRQRGRVDAVSGRQDTHLGQMVLSAVFKGSGPHGFEQSILGTVPPTGTPIHVVNDRVLDELLQPYKDQIFYLGHAYGSTPKMPMWFKHFGHGPTGAGEAYHLGVFGKTGSGKSVLTKMMLAGYARHKEMSILIVDPQGEFAQDFRTEGAPGKFQLPLRKVAAELGRKPVVLPVRDLVLDQWELFEQILCESNFFRGLGMPKGENRDTASSLLVSKLRSSPVKLEGLHKRESFDRAWALLGDQRLQAKFYRTPGRREQFNEDLQDADVDMFYRQHWAPIAQLFRKDREGARTVNSALGWLLRSEHKAGQVPILVVDLSKDAADESMLWSERIQALVIKRLLDGLEWMAEQAYARGSTLNTLVVMDEAHRLAPRGALEDSVAKSMRSTLIDAARTTRKYGLGWMFISQTLSSLHVEIIQQLRIMFFGFGLSLGQEFQALGQLVGSKSSSLELYQSFRDPHSSFDAASRQYSFMTIGPVSPLSFAGSPLFFSAFNTVDAFLHENGLLRGNALGAQ